MSSNLENLVSVGHQAKTRSFVERYGLDVLFSKIAIYFSKVRVFISVSAFTS